MPHAVPCIDCGSLAARSPCPACQSKRDRARNQASPYQQPAWRRLARQATRGQPCSWCGSTNRVAAHHVHHRNQGGPDDLSNLIPLCGHHHSEYHGDTTAGRDTPLRRFVDSHHPPRPDPPL